EYENTTQYPEAVEGEGGSYDKTQNTINYEVNEIKELIEEQQGKIEDLTISVVIDSKQLDTQTIEQVRELVTMAVGTDPANVVVHSMEFDTTFQDDILKGFEDKKKREGLPIWAVALIISSIAILVIIIVSYSKRKHEEQLEREAALQAMEMEEDDDEILNQIDLETEEKNQAKMQIENLVTENPEAVAQLLRNWLNEE